MKEDTGIEVRRIRPEDRVEWLPLWSAFFAFHGRELPAATTASAFERLCDPAQAVHGLGGGGRGRGVGRALVLAVYAAAEQAGAERVTWLVREDNAAAMRLYDALAMRTGLVQYRKDLTGSTRWRA